MRLTQLLSRAPGLGKRRPRARDIMRPLYDAAVRQARAPGFYGPRRAPDTVEGRFEMILLHIYLLVRRLRAEPDAGPQSTELAQALFDVFFDDMDAALREIGVGDLVVGKKVKKMGEAFYGRAQAYEDAFAAAAPDAMAEAVRRNLLVDVDEPPADVLAALSAYVRASDERLSRQSLDALLSGAAPDFAAPPAP